MKSHANCDLWTMTVPINIVLLFFFFNDTATTEIYTLSLHDALPICHRWRSPVDIRGVRRGRTPPYFRSEEHTSELQSRENLVCRLLLEKKKDNEMKNNQVK